MSIAAIAENLAIVLTGAEIATYFALGVSAGVLAWSVGYLWLMARRVLSVTVGD